MTWSDACLPWRRLFRPRVLSLSQLFPSSFSLPGNLLSITQERTARARQHERNRERVRRHAYRHHRLKLVRPFLRAPTPSSQSLIVSHPLRSAWGTMTCLAWRYFDRFRRDWWALRLLVPVYSLTAVDHFLIAASHQVGSIWYAASARSLLPAAYGLILAGHSKAFNCTFIPSLPNAL